MKRGLAAFCKARNPKQAVIRLQLICYLAFTALAISIVINSILLIKGR
ncbi:hypothetical protein GIX45_03295 [Erwinia sp. CPCC 100877]|nr:hypothetical protein [Erwinia sp. CPCC 100877]